MTVRVRRRSSRGDAGFTIVELLISSLIMVVVTGAIFSLMNPAQGTFQVQPEVSDLQQRLRVGIDTLQKDLVMAGAGIYSGPSAGMLSYFIAPIMPYQAFGVAADPAQAIYFRNDAISLLFVPPTPSQTHDLQCDATAVSEIKVNRAAELPAGKTERSVRVRRRRSADHLRRRGQLGLVHGHAGPGRGAAPAAPQHDFSIEYAGRFALTQSVSSMYYLKSDDTTQDVSADRYFDGWNVRPARGGQRRASLRVPVLRRPTASGADRQAADQTAGTVDHLRPEAARARSHQEALAGRRELHVQARPVSGLQVPRLVTLGAGIGQVELTQAMLQ